VFSIFLGCLILSFGSVGGGIIRTSFFPQIASDRVSINLQMPNGTNERITDSIINTIEQKAKQVNQELTSKFLSGTDKILFQNIVKNIGPGSSKGSLIINLLPGENRPTNLSSTIVANPNSRECWKYNWS
jgi:multidrug efflux pump subunit AcrB